MRVSVIGPIADEVRATLGAEVEDDWEFKKVQGGLLLTFPVERSAAALALLKDGFNSFVDMATARVRRTVSLEGHVPEAVAYVASVVGRELPQPKQSRSPDSDADTDTDKECGACSDPLHDATLPSLAASAQHMAQGAIC